MHATTVTKESSVQSNVGFFFVVVNTLLITDMREGERREGGGRNERGRGYKGKKVEYIQ